MASDPSAGAADARKSPFLPDCLQGKVALVTGGGSGIGLEISKQLGLHGARVAIMGRREGVLQEALTLLGALGIQATSSSGDVRKKEDALAAVQKAVGAWGRLDILVNCAAGNFLAPAKDLSPNGFRTVLDIDAVGTFNMCLAAQPYLARDAPGRSASEPGGLIVNISATLHYSSSWYQAHVMAAKAAVDATTRSLALEWGTDFGIRNNTVAPGPIQGTPGMAKLAPEELGIDARKMIPLGRMGTPYDIAMSVLFLASDAGSYINGANIIVDGGNWLFRPRIVDKEVVTQLSRQVERKSRQKGFGKSHQSKL